MPKNTGIASLAERAAVPLAAQMGYRIWDVEYVREGAEQYLRITIDKDGGIDINDCERFHRAVLPLLENYEWDHLEVSSPGAERTLRKPEHFSSFAGERVEVRLFAPDEAGNKSYIGTLASASENEIVLRVGENEIVVPYTKIGKAKTIFDFENV